MKGQISLELTTTYGWAIMIIIVVVTSLVLYTNDDNLRSSEECRLGPQFTCDSAFLDEYGQFNVEFRNNINGLITLEAINITNKSYECPALPIKVKQGNTGKIQCNLDGPFFVEDFEELTFDMIFSVGEDSELYTAKSKVKTKVVNGFNDFSIDCDADNDGKDKFGCGNDLDCNDEDPNLWLSVCREDSDCGTGYTCNDPGSCTANCVESCDVDSDGHDKISCGGNDCNDNDPSRWRAQCWVNSDCPAGYQCTNPGVCSGGCTLSDVGGGGPIIGSG